MTASQLVRCLAIKVKLSDTLNKNQGAELETEYYEKKNRKKKFGDVGD